MITIIDYGMGNLRSVSKAIEFLGGKFCITSRPEDIQQSEKIILPGVGAFGDAARELDTQRLSDPIRAFVKAGKPFLGICLGLQLLFESSEESPGVTGLGLLQGRVRMFDPGHAKIPHMGWNELQIKKSCGVLKDIPDNSHFYFVHSYYADCSNQDDSAGIVEYGGQSFPAVVARDNIYATQFHPEKSQKYGLQILRNFIKL